MPSYTRRRKASESSQLRPPIQSPAEGVGSDAESLKTAGPASQPGAALVTEPTLEDFGGRSDALGG
jgi:hypothetical protein